MNKKRIGIAIGIVLAGAVMARTGYAIESAAPSAGLTQMVKSRLGGQLSVTVIEKDGDGYRVRAELQDVRFDQTPAPNADVAALLKQPFYFTVAPNGEMTSFYFAKGLPADARLLLKQVATSMQSVTPAAPAATWKTTEQDVTGQYEATYEADGNTLTRNKTKYLRPHGVGGLLPMPADSEYQVQSKTQFDLAPSGWPQRVTSNETYDVHFGQTRITAVTSTTATLGSTVSRPELAGPMPLAEVEPEATAEQRTAEDMVRKAAVDRVKGRTFEQLEAELSSPDKKIRDDAQPAMAALLRLKPAELTKAKEAELGGQLDADSKSRMLWCIAQSGTAEAQATLVALLESDSAEARMQAAATIGMLPHPNEATATALLKALSDPSTNVSHTAMLAVGNMALRVKGETNGASRADQLVATVLDGLKQASNDTQARIAIEALGNSGHEQVFAALQPYLAGRNTALKAVAVDSLRLLKGDAVDRAIVAALGDTDKAVRSAAAGTIATRPVSAILPTLTSLMNTEKDVNIRLAVVNGLNMRRTETPAVDTLLTSIASNSSDGAGALAKQVLTN